MTNFSYNIGYFFREAKTTIGLNLLSNLLSLFSTGLIFFILTMVISGWWISSEVIEVIQGEAEINLYFDESLHEMDVLQLVEGVKSIEGVREVRVVDEAEAYGRMVEILGEEARVLEFFDDNPFSPFIEVKIHLDKITPILENVVSIKGIEHVRDNREILDRLGNTARILKLLGYLAVVAVGVSTLIIISHMIRMGIYNNRDQINTLRLLGAPEAFIGFPFLLVGVVVTLGGGLVASIMSSFALKEVYAQMTGPLPFIPLPPLEMILGELVLLIVTLSVGLGIVGSLMGLSLEKSNE